VHSASSTPPAADDIEVAESPSKKRLSSPLEPPAHLSKKASKPANTGQNPRKKTSWVKPNRAQQKHLPDDIAPFKVSPLL
jgi:hypothetical protein